MSVAITLEARGDGFSIRDIKDTIARALTNDLGLARVRLDSFAQECAKMESRHGMTSDEFWQRFEAGELGDDAVWFDWYAIKRGLDIWDRQVRILSGLVQ